MIWKLRIPAVLLAFFTVPVIVLTALPHQPEPIPGFVQYQEAQSLVYRESSDTRRIEALLASALDQFSRAPAGPLPDYWTARTHLLAATWYNWRNESRSAQRELSVVFERIGDALADGDFSDGFRVRADAHSQMAMARGFVYMIRNGEDAKNDTLQALALDPDNIHANITGAGYFLNAPPFAGGNVPRGLSLLEHALTLEPESEWDSFLVFIWLAQGYAKQEQTVQALRYWEQASAIFPGSSILQTVAAENGFTRSR